MANRKSNQLKLECLAIRIVLLCEYLQYKTTGLIKHNLSRAVAFYGWRYTLCNPVENVNTTVDDHVESQYKNTTTLRRARALFNRLQGMVKETNVTPWDLESWPLKTPQKKAANNCCSGTMRFALMLRGSRSHSTIPLGDCDA